MRPQIQPPQQLCIGVQRALAVLDGKQLSVAVKCLELLLRHRGMLTDRQQVPVGTGTPAQ